MEDKSVEGKIMKCNKRKKKRNKNEKERE